MPFVASSSLGVWMGQHCLPRADRHSSFLHVPCLHCVSSSARSDARFTESTRERSCALLLRSLRGHSSWPCLLWRQSSSDLKVLIVRRTRWEVERSHRVCQISKHKFQVQNKLDRNLNTRLNFCIDLNLRVQSLLKTMSIILWFDLLIEFEWTLAWKRALKAIFKGGRHTLDILVVFLERENILVLDGFSKFSNLWIKGVRGLFIGKLPPPPWKSRWALTSCWTLT